MKNTELVAFSLKKKLIEKLNDLPRKNLPNKSRLVGQLLTKWLVDMGYVVSGSI